MSKRQVMSLGIGLVMGIAQAAHAGALGIPLD